SRRRHTRWPRDWSSDVCSSDLLVLNDLVAWAYTTGRVYIKSDGTPWRPIVHIRDITAAILRVLNAPQHLIHNAIFNVGQTEENRSEERRVGKECRYRWAPSDEK